MMNEDRMKVAGPRPATTLAALAALLAPWGFASGPTTPEQPPAASVEVAGLRVVKPGYEGKQELRAFNWHEGTTVALLVTRPGGGLIGFDDDASAVQSFVDDQGRNLLVKAGFSQPGFSSFANISADGKAAMLEVGGGAIPTQGARELRIRAKAVFQVASQKTTAKQTGIAARKGSKVQAGPVTLEIEKVGKPEWGSEPFAIVFKAKQELGAIASVRFLDASGKEVESSTGGTMTSRFGDAIDVQREYKLERKVDTFAIEIAYWTDLRAEEIPVDVSVSVGL
jgi:hypothetical protein